MLKECYRLWYYSVSHDQMLLRCRNELIGTNKDIFFDGIRYIEIPTMFEDAIIEKPSISDLDYLRSRVELKDDMVTVLKINGKRYFVVAAHRHIEENSLDYSEVPFSIGMIPQGPLEANGWDIFFEIFLDGYMKFKNSAEYIPKSGDPDNMQLYSRYGFMFSQMKKKENQIKLIELISNPRDAFYLLLAVDKIAASVIPEMEKLLHRYLCSEEITDEELGIIGDADYSPSGDFIRKQLKLMAITGLKYYLSVDNVKLLKKFENDQDMYIKCVAQKSIAYMKHRMSK